MRTIRFALAIVIGLCLMLIISANMAPVDLHLAPQALGVQELSLRGVPLGIVIVGAVLVGVLLGLLIEFFREAKHRGLLAAKRKELARLQSENARLAKEIGADPDDLRLLAG